MTNFKIVEKNPVFEESLKRLPIAVRKEVEEVKELLAKDPESIAKPLKGELRGYYKVYLGNRRYRLICRIEVNTKKVFLYYVKPRSIAYRD